MPVQTSAKPEGNASYLGHPQHPQHARWLVGARGGNRGFVGHKDIFGLKKWNALSDYCVAAPRDVEVSTPYKNSCHPREE